MRHWYNRLGTRIGLAALLLLGSASYLAAQGVISLCYFTSSFVCQKVDTVTPLPVTGTLTVSPVTGTTTQTKVTITSGGTYQQALAATAARKGCTIQFSSANTSSHVGYVFFGSAPADTTTSFTLVPGQALSCGVPGVVLTDAVQLTSSNNSDVFIVANQ